MPRGRQSRTSSKHRSAAAHARRRAESRNKRGGSNYINVPQGTNFFEAKEDERRLDILNYTVTVENHPEKIPVGDPYYERTIFVHYGVGVESKAFLCPKSVGKRCPICEERGRMSREPGVDKKVLQALKPKERQLFNVIDLDNEDKGIQLWEFSYWNFGNLLEQELAAPRNVKNFVFSDLEGGKTVLIRFSQERGDEGRIYIKATRIDFMDRNGDYDESVGKEVHNLDTILNFPTYEELKREFLEEGDEVDQEPTARSDEDTTPPKKGIKRHPRREAEEEEPEEEAEEGEEEVEGDGEEVEGEEPEPEEERKTLPKKKPTGRTKSTRTKGKSSKGKCPVADGTFGTDNNEYDECEKCEHWDACADEYDKTQGDEG